MNKYKEAKTNIVNTLVRIVGYPTYKKQFERDLEVLGKLLEKTTPKKAIAVKGWDNLFICPSCDENFFKVNFCPTKYCPYCGQALDWSK